MNRTAQDFRECLLEHGKTLDEGAPDRCATHTHGHGAVRAGHAQRLSAAFNPTPPTSCDDVHPR